MAIYTHLTSPQISTLLSAYELGELRSFDGATDGIENSTYFLSLNNGVKLVLTLFESFSEQQLPFYIELTSALHEKGLPVPCPVRDKSGSALHDIAGKPVLLFPRAVGEHLRQPNLQQIGKFATCLARTHQHCLSLALRYPEPSQVSWMAETWEFVKPSLSVVENEVLERQFQLRKEHQALAIPKAVIHADLFTDNVLFDGGEVSGIIDFYHAGFDSLILDMATALNDWCINSDGLVDEEKRQIFITAYESQRRLTVEEQQHFDTAQQLAATRFWLSRLKTKLQVQQGLYQEVKDPAPCKRLLFQHLGIRHLND